MKRRILIWRVPCTRVHWWSWSRRKVDRRGYLGVFQRLRNVRGSMKGHASFTNMLSSCFTWGRSQRKFPRGQRKKKCQNGSKRNEMNYIRRTLPLRKRGGTRRGSKTLSSQDNVRSTRKESLPIPPITTHGSNMPKWKKKMKMVWGRGRPPATRIRCERFMSGPSPTSPLRWKTSNIGDGTSTYGSTTLSTKKWGDMILIAHPRYTMRA
mmetsp:Transcript_29840/g.62336  ORF Transcript_29840/g.62336 Transcript_29840/m.62336 type:complete len:209 (+) Transcript_29840:900-1526(+)